MDIWVNNLQFPYNYFDLFPKVSENNYILACFEPIDLCVLFTGVLGSVKWEEPKKHGMI